MSSTRSRPLVGGLRIFIDPNRNLTRLDQPPHTWTQLEPESDDFREVARWVHLSLCMLESPQGRRSLIEFGERLVGGWDRMGESHNFWNYGESMEYCVDFFLRRMRQRFPDIYLTSTIRGDGSTKRNTLGARLRDYDPKAAAVHSLHRLLPEHSRFADYACKHHLREGNTRASDAAKLEHGLHNFRGSYEVIYRNLEAMMGLLSGRRHLDVPPDVQTGYSNSFVSKAGRVWGNAFLRGCPEYVAEPNNILNWRQAGTAYWVDKNGSCQLMSLIWIENFIRGDFDFRPGAMISPASRGPESFEVVLSDRYHMICVRNQGLLLDVAQRRSSRGQEEPRQRPTETADDTYKGKSRGPSNFSKR